MSRARAPLAVLVFALVAAVCALGLARRAARSPSAAESSSPRVGLLVYELVAFDVRRAVGLDTGVEIAPAGRTFAVITVRRANATQADARATTRGLEYVAPDGAAYTAWRIHRVRCHAGGSASESAGGGDEGANDCATLEPGGAREDELVYSVPESALGAGARLRVTAAPGEPGPRVAHLALP